MTACAGRGPPSADDPAAEGEGEGEHATLDVFVNERPHDVDNEELLVLEDDSVRFGDLLHVVVRDLAPGSAIDIDSAGPGGTSSARFVADDDGIVNLARDAPTAGTWSSADVDGFLWSATNPPEPPAEGTPVDIGVHLVVRAAPGDVLAERTILRRFIDERVVVEPVDNTADGGRIVGSFAFPEGATGPLPAVLCFGGAEGGRASGELMAKYLATLGFAALGVAYFAEEGLPPLPLEIPLEILEEDLALLTADPRVDASHIAVMGASLGGMLGLMLGARYPDIISAVIVTVPSGVVWAQPNGLSPFAAGDEPVPAYVADVATHYTTGDNGFRHYDLSAGYLDALATPDEAMLAAATTHSEDIAGPVFISAGDDDKLWPSCVLGQIAADRRTAAGVADDDVVLCHANAGHLISGFPGIATEQLVGERLNVGFGYIQFGGTAEGTAHALRERDTALRAFLERFAAR